MAGGGVGAPDGVLQRQASGQAGGEHADEAVASTMRRPHRGRDGDDLAASVRRRISDAGAPRGAGSPAKCRRTVLTEWRT